MTSRERIRSALSHKQPDRTPCFEYLLLSPIADQLLGRPYAGDPANWSALVAELGWKGAIERIATDQLDLADLLGHDMLYVCPNPPSEQTDPAPPSFLGSQPGGDPDDPVAKVELAIGKSALEAPPADETLFVYETLKDQMRRRGMDLPILAPAYRHGVWTNVDLMQTMILDPQVAERHFELMTQKALAAIEKYASLGVDQVAIGGDFSGSRPLISPQAYRDFIMPEVRKLSRRIHEHGMFAVNASDGDLWLVIEDFLLGCEVDGYLEIDSFAGMDLRRLKQGYGDRITFYGNIDCGNVLSFASPEEIRRHVIACLEAGMGSGGHILCASNAIIESIPLVNYVAYVNAYRDFFDLPGIQV